MTPENIAICQKLYDPPTPYQSIHRSTKSTPPPITIHHDTLLTAIRKTKSGTAAGPSGDFPQFLKDFALYQPDKSSPDHYPHFSAVATVAQLILNAKISTQAHPFLASNWFMALHKDPANPSKLRPIGMGSAWRRLLGRYLISVFTPEIAKLFLRYGQLGIAIKGSIEIIVHATKLQLEKYLSPGVETRALPLLDLENMFNKASRLAAQDQLQNQPTLRLMLPFVKLLYSTPTHCYYQNSSNQISYFLQEEGHCQGCPLAGFLSCLVHYAKS